MDEDKKGEQNAEGTPTSTEITTEPSQKTEEKTPIEEELEREEKKGARTEPEKAAFSLKKNAERAKELGLDPLVILGIKKPEAEEEGDDTPVTVGTLRKMTLESSRKTALQLAEEIPDQHERELTIRYLSRIIPSEDPQEDLRLARQAVNGVKHGMMAEEAGRQAEVKRHGSGAGAPPKQANPEGELEANEIPFTRPPFNLTREQIIAKRPKV